MTPNDWDDNDPGDLPVRWRERDEDSACERCGTDMEVDARYCEACYNRITQAQHKR
jgi:predicted amidophosphoribosyltransferase